MDEGAQRLLRDLAEWSPGGGVVSVYLDVDPADRGGRWRIELEQRLKHLAAEADPAERDAMADVSKRILDRFPADAPHRSGRTHVGFAEIARGGREVWHSFQTALGESLVVRDAAPWLTPLVAALERGQATGVILTAAESARAFEWSQGTLTEIGAWELELFSNDWRERKAPRSNPQAPGTTTSAAGRDQHDQRLEHNRARFLKELGQIVEGRFGDRGWRRVLVFGEGDLPDLLAAGLGEGTRAVRGIHADLIRAPDAEVLEHVEREVAALNAERERALLERVEEAVGSEAGVAAGPEEVLQALEQGRASHLILDFARGARPGGEEPRTEEMIRRGVTTGAEITTVQDEECAERLEERDGAVALLRY